MIFAKFNPPLVCMLFGVLLLLGCHQVDTTASFPEVLSVSNPSASTSGMPNFAGDGSSTYMTWIDTEEETHYLRMAKWNGDAWVDALTLAEGTDWFVNWADFPGSVHLPNGNKAVYWLQKSGEGTFHYDIAWKYFKAGQWSETETLNTDGLQAEHGFVSMVALADGRMLASWLDGRRTVGAEAGMESHDHGGHYGAMTLRAALFDSDFNRLEEWELDERVCDCCQTALQATDKGAVLLYRDRSEEEIRDISVKVFDGSHWSDELPLHQDHWKIAGCPVNGPSLASDGETVLAAWFTGAGDTLQIACKISRDGGKNFGEAIRLNTYPGPGRVHTVHLPERNSFVVVWMETIPSDGTLIMAAELDKAGNLLRKWSVVKGTEARAGGFPRVSWDGEKLLFAWTADEETRSLQTAIQSLNE